jgi:hypothetical protein
MRPLSRIAFVLLLAFAAGACAATTGTAHAGGWATVELGETPSGLVTGEPWRVELIVKQHGITPLAGVTPSVRIDNGEGVVRTFRARPTETVGTYVAEVDFPAAGTWKTRIFDGFTDALPHRLSPLTVTDGSGTSPGGSDFPWPQVVMIVVVALLFLGGILATLDRPRLHVGTFGLRGRAA